VWWRKVLIPCKPGVGEREKKEGEREEEEEEEEECRRRNMYPNIDFKGPPIMT
jgi:hypothetical protein